MLRLNLLFIILFISLTASAQIRPEMAQRIRQLKSTGVDTLVYFNSMHPGGMPIPLGQNYIPATKDYLIWKEKGKSYIQRFYDCYRYKPRAIDPKFMSMVINQYNKLKNEEILGANMTVDHAPHTLFNIYSPFRRVL